MKLPQGLPHLNGVRGTIARVAYLLIAVPTIVAVACSIWFVTIDMTHNFPATTSLDFRTFTRDAGHYVGGVGPEAARAGLRTDDRILAIGSATMRPGASEFEIGEALVAAAGPKVTLRVAGRDGRERTVSLARHAAPWLRIDSFSGLPLWCYAIMSMMVSSSFPVTLLVASLLLFHRRRRDPEAMLFAFSLLMMVVQGGTLWWWDGSPFSYDALQAWWLTGWAASFIAIAGFPDGRFVTRWSRISVIVSLGFAALNIGYLGLVGVSDSWSWFDAAFGLAGAAAGVAVVLRYRRTPPGAERQQIKWAVGGSCVTLAAVVMVVFLSGLGVQPGGGNPIATLGMTLLYILASLSMPLGLMISLLRYRLYDAEATMSRSALYATLTLSLLAIFAGSEKVIEALGEQYFGGSLGAMAGGIGAALAAVMIAPLHHRLSGWSERRFQRALVRLRKELPLLVGDLRETAKLTEIADAVLKRIEAGVRARHGVVIIDEAVAAAHGIAGTEVEIWRRGWVPRAEDGLDCRSDDPVFPMRVPLDADGCGRVGWVLLGPRPDGSFFGRDEREVLAEIADPVARAIAIAKQREGHLAALDERFGLIEATVARLLTATRLGASEPNPHQAR